MFAPQTKRARFLDLPIEKPGRQFNDALRCATSYYGRSEAKEAVILSLRLNHLYNFRMQFRRQTPPGGDKDADANLPTPSLAVSVLESSSHSLHLLNHLWKHLRSAKYGLNQKLIDAMKVTEIGQASSDRAESSISYFSLFSDDEGDDKLSFHARFCHYLQKAMNELDALLLDADACKLAEENHIRLLEEWIAEYPSDASLYKVDKRKKHNHEYYTDELMAVWLVHCQDDIDKLTATDSSGTKFWTDKKREKFASVGTGDDALEVIANKAEQRIKTKSKAKGKRGHEEGNPPASDLSPPPPKRASPPQ